MFTVIYDYYEWSDQDEYLGENTDYQEFDTLAEAQAYALEVLGVDGVKRAWVTP